MASISITSLENDSIDAEAFTCNDGSAFVVLRIGDITVYVAEFDATCASNIRRIAAALTTAADDLERR